MCILPHFFSVVKWCNFFLFFFLFGIHFFSLFFLFNPMLLGIFCFYAILWCFFPQYLGFHHNLSHFFVPWINIVLDFYLKSTPCLSCLLAIISVHYLSELVRSYRVLKDQLDFFEAAELCDYQYLQFHFWISLSDIGFPGPRKYQLFHKNKNFLENIYKFERPKNWIWCETNDVFRFLANLYQLEKF